MTRALLLLLLCAPAVAQEAVRDLTGAAAQTKHLTPNQLDRWLFDGEKDETVIAHVTSQEFDPVLSLAASGAKEGAALIEVDDPGSESRFAFRLPATGKYEIRVNAFKFQGGGNYTLRVHRFAAAPAEVGKRAGGTLDRDGRGYHRIAAKRDTVLVPSVTGIGADALRVLDHKGRELRLWNGAVTVEADGELSVLGFGPPNQRYELLVREARRRELAPGNVVASKAESGEADVWNLVGKPGEFRVVELQKKGDVNARLLFAPTEPTPEPRVRRPGEPPELAFMPVRSRGDRLRFAAVFGRSGRYQLQVVADTAAEYTVTVSDPTVALEPGKDAAGEIPVGGSRFYSFAGTPGQLFLAQLASAKFAPTLRLYDRTGTLLAEGTGDDAARLTHMVTAEGTYRLQVSADGDGGSGEFRLGVKAATVGVLKIGERGKGTLPAGGTDFQAFDGKEGQVVFVSVRSPAFDPTVTVRGPDGVLIAGDRQASPATGSLTAVRLPKTGRYTLGISARRGAGEYTVRVLDGD